MKSDERGIDMDNSVRDFQRKVENRMFAIEHSGKEAGPDATGDGQKIESKEPHTWDVLNENLSDADACKFFDGYLPLYSHHTFWGSFIIFWKKVLRKLLKIFLGWYIFPIYQRQSHFNGKIINAVSSERDLLAGLYEKIDELNGTIEKLKEQNQKLTSELSGMTGELSEKNRQITDEIRNVRDSAASELNMAVEELRTRDQSLTEETASLQEGLESAVEELRGRDQILTGETASLREGLESANETISVFQRDVSASTACIKEKLRKIENLPTDDDEFYHCFEEKFRGTREDIRDRLRIYVPIIREHLPDWSGGTFVDVGSGRGEWLDILKENGATDYVGVDLNQRQNEICEGFGHRTICGDCIEYLASLPEGSVDLISGFQIIEHLCMSDLMELLRQSYRALKKGGMILFETQNPRNLIVGADTFFIDPSHKRVLEPRMVEFLAEWCGYRQIQILDANSHEKWAGITEESAIKENEEIVKAVNELYWLVYGPQDYALFAVKE